MQRIAFYTCVTGCYDEVPPPEKIDSRFSYLMYTDRPESVRSPWVGRDLPVSGLSSKDTNRYVKILPHRVPELADFDITVYLDGRVTIREPANSLVEMLVTAPNGLHMFAHPVRDCLYEEAYVCAVIGLESALVLGRQVRRYRAAGMPARAGLFGGGVIIRRNLPEVAALMERWWVEYSGFAKRDQVSLPFVTWQTGFTVRSLGNFAGNRYFALGRHIEPRNVQGKWGAFRNRLIFKMASTLPV